MGMEDLELLKHLHSIRLWFRCPPVMVVSIHAYVSIFPDSSCNTYKFVSAPEVHDAPGRFAFLDGGVVLCLPMFYLQGSIPITLCSNIIV
jgi:hypothetical protein